ncbi:MAG: 30S ribosomal protein S3 [Candidatus Pacebacteria bacterium]|nr:30S ribosomal protein S3 [Candidatus Paceibacterota bacterium]
MSHRVHPKIFRIQRTNDWASKGFYGKYPSNYLEEDYKIREFLHKKLKLASIEKINIERFSSKLNIIIFTSRPGIIIGRGGQGVEQLRKELLKKITTKNALKIEVQAVKNSWTSATLTAQWMARGIEKRIAFRRVLKQSLSKIMSQKGIQGARVQVAGRLNGVEMARREWLKEGKLPRQTIRSNIDYGTDRAICSYGVIGIKVWIYKGEDLD